MKAEFRVPDINTEYGFTLHGIIARTHKKESDCLYFLRFVVATHNGDIFVKTNEGKIKTTLEQLSIYNVNIAGQSKNLAQLIQQYKIFEYEDVVFEKELDPEEKGKYINFYEELEYYNPVEQWVIRNYDRVYKKGFVMQDIEKSFPDMTPQTIGKKLKGVCDAFTKSPKQLQEHFHSRKYTKKSTLYRIKPFDQLSPTFQTLVELLEHENEDSDDDDIFNAPIEDFEKYLASIHF